MTKQRNLLAQFSDALAAHALTAGRIAVSVHPSSGRRLGGILWQPDVVLTSEQSLPRDGGYRVAAANQPVVEATLVGADPGTNIAVLRLGQALPFTAATSAQPRVGSIALAIAADADGAASVRLAIVNAVGPEWHSRAGGRIEQRIVLDAQLAPTEEGGPVIDAEGALLGMSTFGPRGRVLVIPSATLGRVVPRLLQEGRIARGWLGVALHPVAVPDNLRDAAGHKTGMMVMSTVDDGPGAKAGVMAGDILITVGGKPATGRLAAILDTDSVGRDVDLRVIRGGAIKDMSATIAARP